MHGPPRKTLSSESISDVLWKRLSLLKSMESQQGMMKVSVAVSRGTTSLSQVARRVMSTL